MGEHGFDWKGVAASAIASGVGYGVAQGVGQLQYGAGWSGMSPEALQADSFNTAVRGVGAGIAGGAASTLARGGSLGRNVGAIAADAVGSTVGNMVVGQVADASTGKTASATNGSMSSLYGVGGNYDDLVWQATQQSYNVDAGDQFAGMANWDLALSQQAFVSGLQDEFGTRANEMLSASRAQDQALKQQLGAQFAGEANMSLAAQRAAHVAAAVRINTAGLDLARGPAHLVGRFAGDRRKRYPCAFGQRSAGSVERPA